MKGHRELKAVQGLTPVDEESFRKGVERAHNKLKCWMISGQFGLILIQQHLDIGVFMTTDQSRIAATNGVSRKLIEVAEAAGYSQEICGYHKVTIGYALLLARGQLDRVPEVPTMPRPDFICSNNGCQSHLWAGEALGRILDVPVIGIDLPFEYDVARGERILPYLESDLREVLDILETWTGRPFDWPRLGERIKGLAEVADMRNEVTQMCKTCRPSVCSALDLIPASWVHRACLVEESKRAYEALREEIQGRIERGERDIPEEKIRIVWRGGFPCEKTGAIKELLARHGATLCSSQYSTGSGAETGEGLDPGDPLRTLVWMLKESNANKSVDARLANRIKPIIEGFNADGIIFHNMRTCKINGIPMLITAAQVEKELGIPTLIVESDNIDPAFYAETQVENRIESFLERIADSKAGA